MATRNALRIVSRRFSSGKEEKAAKNVFIKKMEQGKLEKIARQGPGEQAAAGSASGAKLGRIRRFSSGKVLSEEERAAENVFIKKKEHEKLEKMGRQLEKIARQLTQGPGEQAAAGSASGEKLRRVRRFSSGRVLSEEESAAENVFIKKMEQEKLEKISRQLEKLEDKARDDKARRDVVAVAILCAIGWWFFKSG